MPTDPRKPTAPPPRAAPRFASPDEERAWFERHAAEAAGDELAENPFAGPSGPARKVAYSLRLDAADVDRLEAAAARRGVRPTQLAREWITERLATEPGGDEGLVERVASRGAARRRVAAEREAVTRELASPGPRSR